MKLAVSVATDCLAGLASWVKRRMPIPRNWWRRFPGSLPVFWKQHLRD